MRVAVTGLHAETNTFLPVPGDLEAFARCGVLRGDDIVSRFADSGTTIAGFLSACHSLHVEVAPLIHADLLASCGTITTDAFETITHEIVRELVQRGPFDVVLLGLHGAAVADEYPDADGELATRVRAAVGREVTIGMALDLHANVTERMVGAADVCVGYRENPHRDPRERAVECAGLAIRHAAGDLRPVQRLIRLPMVVPILGGWTDEGAMRDVMDRAAGIAENYSLVSYSVFHGFGYADVPEMGSSVLAVADNDTVAADSAAREIAAVLWDAREDLRGDALPTADAITRAHRRAAGSGPVVLLDVGDNIGGGAPGDSTVLLREALARDTRGYVTTLCDEGAAQRALHAGIGAEVEVQVGATSPVSVGPRLRIRGRCSHISDGRFEDGNVTHGGFRFFDGGPTIRLSTDCDQELVITSRAVPTWTPEQLRAVGIDPTSVRVIVAKGVVAPRAGYASITSDFLLVDTPGVTAADLRRFAFVRRRQPLWPIDCVAGDIRVGTSHGVV